MKLKALIADDSKVMRGIVMTTLANSKLAEFEFIEAQDGEDALAKFNPKDIDIVFADWNMPKMTGVDFVRKLRGLPDAQHIPVIMVTSEKSLGKMEVALDEVGADEYICKPFTSDDFVRKIAKLIDEISLRKQKASGGGFFSKILGKKD